MKIERIIPFLVNRFLLVRVYTDAGIVGNGEAGLWAHHESVARTIEELSEYYIGKDPLRMDHHFQVLSRETHFSGAILSAALSAIDIALWDIFGKFTNLPVHQLLGGKVRDKVKVFGGVGGRNIEEFVKSAVRYAEQNYQSLRIMPFLPDFEKESPTRVISTAAEIVKQVRAAVGDSIDIGVECHRNFRPEEAITLAHAIEPYRILFYEDPVAPESNEAVSYVAQNINLPIATAERFFTLYQFRELIDRRCVSWIRPDPSLVGGFTQAKKIAAVAESSFVGIFPHLMGSPVNVASFVQFDAATPNYVLQEGLENSDAFNEIVDHPIEREGGYMLVSDRPGIGLEIQESKLSKYPFVPRKITGFFHADGSVAH